MVRKGNLAVFEGNSISETEKVTPTKIGVDTLGINPYLQNTHQNWCACIFHQTCMNFLSQFRSIENFDDHGL